MLAIVMCKAPVPGRVKTRLMPGYTAAEAAELHAAMAATVIRRAAGLFDRLWIAADDPADPFFSAFGMPIVAQGAGDLGMRMGRLLRMAAGEGAWPVLFLGTDSPHMPESRLRATESLLDTCDVVIGPVEDGGYDLIGFSAPHAALFEGIDWGSSAVSRQSIAAAAALGLDCQLLDTGFDIDTAADLARAAGYWPMPPLPKGKDRERPA